MSLTDVPESGIYYQKGAIVEIVVQLIDINTGDPVQLQTATGLSISILYPDLISSQVFTAELYSDGSDGMIAYTTINDGSTVDLSEVGLYKVQGSAVVGGVPLPPSRESDFYVLPNVVGGSISPPTVNASGVVLLDPSSVRYVGTVSPSGVLSFAAQPEGPAVYLQFNSLVMMDSAGTYWVITMGADGEYDATPGGTFPHALGNFLLVDTNNKTWVVTISEQGVLTPA